MRITDEQLRLVRERAEKLRTRRQRLLRRGTAALCLLLAAALGLVLPGMEGGAALPEEAAFGSIVLTSPGLSYIVIAILAFALGVCVTLLCIQRRAQGRDGEDRDE